ncbi:MAG TPA: efflux RND transporter periplasmic adaptor subunit [Xanthobacteraceae bacterium]|nr:efflux RND transporter periplasmic adaptor subunit [Xanthobacteraceae bacterium]
MHAPVALRSKTKKAEQAVRNWIKPHWAKRRWWVIAIVIVGAGAAAYFERGTLYDWFAGPQAAATILVSGNIEAHQSVLGFKTVQSRIVELPFDEGQWVDKGTLIARLDDADYRQQVVINQAALNMQERQLAAAQQNLTAAEQTVESDSADLTFRQQEYDRAAMLLKQGSGTVEQRDQTYAALRQSTAAHERDSALRNAAERQIELAKAAIESAAATLKMSQIVLGYTVLTAPFSGVIQVRQAELGEIMVPGTPVVTLADLDHVWLRAYINETDIGKVRYGEEATVTTDTYPGKIYKGRVSFISGNAEFTPKSVETHAERVTLVYRIRIDIENPTHELVPGMPADAVLNALPAGRS